MKYNSILKLLLVAIGLQLNSCAKEKLKTEQNNKGSKVIPLNKDICQVSEVFGSGNPYYTFIQKHKIFDLEKVRSFTEKDIDLDGLKEAFFVTDSQLAISNCPDCPTPRMIYLLQNDHGTIKQIPINYKETELYYISNAKLISLKGKKQSYIYIQSFAPEDPVGFSDGFSLIELFNGQLEEIHTSVFSYESKLIDVNKDQYFEGYTTVGADIRDDIVTYREFEKGTKPVYKFAEIPAYPYSVEDVLFEYISLLSLDLARSPELKKRLQQICIDKSPMPSQFAKEEWYKIGKRIGWSWSRGYDNPYIRFEVQKGQDDSRTSVVVYIEDEQGNKGQFQFQLQKLAAKWRISEVEFILENI